MGLYHHKLAHLHHHLHSSLVKAPLLIIGGGYFINEKQKELQYLLERYELNVIELLQLNRRCYEEINVSKLGKKSIDLCASL